MEDFMANLVDYGLLLLVSVAIILVAVMIITLSNSGTSVHSHVSRIGRKPARIEVPRARGHISISVRTIDEDHLWMRIDAPTDTEVRVEGEGEATHVLSRSMTSDH